MEQFLIYLWSISEGISFLFLIIASLSFFVVIWLLLTIAFDGDLEWDDAKSYIYRSGIMAIIFAVLCIAIPSKQDLALIFLYPSIKQGTLNVVQSDTTKKMVEVLNGYLDKQLEELNNDR